MKASMKRWLILSLTVLLGLVSLLTIDFYYRAQIRKQNARQLTLAGENIVDHLEDGVHTRILAVEDLKAFLLAVPDFPDWESFDRYAAFLIAHYPELCARNWHGEIEFRGEPGVGTSVISHIPLRPER
jgi:hypothetical protein